MTALPKPLEAILDLARWAPSGDNAQPWKFQILGDRDIEVLIRRTNPNIYEYREGEPTLLSAGALLENIEIAAPRFGLKAHWRYVSSAGGVDRIAVHFSDDDTLPNIDLSAEITRRSVDRRPFKMRSLTGDQKERLASALGEGLHVQWFESLADRRAISGVSGLATRIRLAIPETYPVHRSIVDWESSESERGIPSKALGLDPVTLLLTRWAMTSWSRTRLMNVLGAPTLASLQMDALPGLFCASYFALRIKRQATESTTALAETLRAGQSIQRFWLTASQLGLVMQPCVAVLAFWVYAATGRKFSASLHAQRMAMKLARDAEAIFGPNEEIIFLARIGFPRSKSASRSTRYPLAQLMVP